MTRPLPISKSFVEEISIPNSFDSKLILPKFSSLNL